MRSNLPKLKAIIALQLISFLCVIVKIMNNDNEPSSLVSFLRQTDEKLVSTNVSLNYY